MGNGYVVRFGAGRARRYLARAAVSVFSQGGHQPVVWVKDIAHAEIFETPVAARAFALEALSHGHWDIGLAARADQPAHEVDAGLAALRAAA